MSQQRLDDQAVYQAGITLRTELEMVMPEVIMQRRPANWAIDGSVIPMTMDLPLGVKTIREEIQTDVGEAQFYSDYSSDFGGADYTTERFDYRVIEIAHSFVYSILELNAAGYANRELVARKARLMQDHIDNKMHRFALFGADKLNLTGFYNDANVEVKDTGFDPNTNDVDLHIQFVTNEIVDYTNKHLLTAGLGAMVVPYSLWARWTSLRIENTATSLASYFTNIFGDATGLVPGGLRILPVNESRSDLLDQYNVTRAQAGFDRIVILPNNVEDVMGLKAYSMQTLPPQPQNMKFRVNGYRGLTQLMVHRPTEVVYTDITPVV